MGIHNLGFTQATTSKLSNNMTATEKKAIRSLIARKKLRVSNALTADEKAFYQTQIVALTNYIN